MKQFTTKQQTEKLVELGFPKPQSIASVKMGTFMGTKIPCIEKEFAYSIGELIGLLPPIHPQTGCGILTHYNIIMDKWVIDSTSMDICCENELIDALYGLVIILKGKGIL